MKRPNPQSKPRAKAAPAAKRPPAKAPAKKRPPDTRFTRDMKRILSLIPTLTANPGIRIADLQRLSGYTSKKKLQTDLEKVLYFGKPPFTPGDYIDIYIEEDRVFLELPQGLDRPLELTVDEWAMVQNLITQTLEFYTRAHGDRKELASILEKMTRVPLAMDYGPYTRKRSLLLRAIEDNRQAEFHYQSLSAPQAEIRRIDPWAVFSHHGSIYCLGYCHMRRSSRIFHLERMEHLEMLEAAQEARPAGVREHLEQSAVFHDADAGFSASIALQTSVQGSLAGILPLRQLEPLKGRPGWVKAQVKVRDSLYFRSVLRGYGPLVEILEPEHLRKSFISDLRQIPLPTPFQLDSQGNP